VRGLGILGRILYTYTILPLPTSTPALGKDTQCVAWCAEMPTSLIPSLTHPHAWFVRRFVLIPGEESRDTISKPEDAHSTHPLNRSIAVDHPRSRARKVDVVWLTHRYHHLRPDRARHSVEAGHPIRNPRYLVCPVDRRMGDRRFLRGLLDSDTKH